MTVERSVSVVIPNLNHGHLIGETIDSLAVQSFRDFEIIVIDDDPTRTTHDAVMRKKSDHPNLEIRYFHPQEEPQGTHHALNIGMRMIEGDAFAWVASDEICLPNKLDTLRRELVRNDLEMVFSGFREMNAAGEDIDVVSYGYLKRPLLEELCFHNFVNSSTVMIRREAISEVGPIPDPTGDDQAYWPAGDYGWWLEFASRGRVGIVDAPLNRRRRESTYYGSEYDIVPAMYRYYLRRFFRSHAPNSIFPERGAMESARRLQMVFLKHEMYTEALAEPDPGDDPSRTVAAHLAALDRYRLARFDYARGRFAKALANLRRAHALFPDETYAYHIGLCLYQLGDLAGAAPWFLGLAEASDFLLTNSRRYHCNAHFYLGLIRHVQESHDEAGKWLRMCLDINPLHGKAREVLGET